MVGQPATDLHVSLQEECSQSKNELSGITIDNHAGL